MYPVHYAEVGDCDHEYCWGAQLSCRHRHRLVYGIGRNARLWEPSPRPRGALYSASISQDPRRRMANCDSGERLLDHSTSSLAVEPRHGKR